MKPLKIDLPGGLVLRRATPADRDSLLAINTQLLGLDTKVEMNYLLDGGYPGVRLEDFLVVVEPGGRVVSALSLIEQELRVGRTRLRIGNPEFVTTLPEYQGQGLIRQHFAILEQWQKERGLAFSLIMGIPYFYRLFGYEYALEDYRPGFLYPGVHQPRLAGLPDFEVRLIQESDAPALARMYAETAAQADIALALPDEGWVWSARVRRREENMIEDWIALDQGQPLASARLYGKGNSVTVSRFAGNLKGQQAIIKRALALPGLEKLGINTVRDNPLSRWIATLEPGRRETYGNYVRIIDPALAFRQLGPEFENRLALSPMAGLSREVELSFYRFSVQLVFEGGKLVSAENRPGNPNPRIGLPPDLLPKILMGYRSLEELARFYPDLNVPVVEDWELLQVLFPPLSSMVNFFI
ncbi:MAG: hypothetical protein JWP00_4983 [Chloroflexi bacterium]|jgi:GNAT superfamily N-acetyltransferase|nr:hypothetical protein [Chloroflexota bacterium]